MSKSSKYPINGICRFENFAQQVENNNFTAIPIGIMCEFDGWPCGRKNSLDTLLDERNGWLSNGTLSIEYGFRVEAVQYADGIWQFNFGDKYINFDQREDVIEFELYKTFFGKPWCYLYTPRTLVNFYSRIFTTKTYPVPERFSEYYWRTMPEILQIAHGVIRNYDCNRRHLEIAKDLEFQNVNRFCERQFIQEENLDCRMNYFDAFQTASDYSLNYYLAHLLKNVVGTKQLTDVLKKMRLEEMPTEFMKQCTRYFFENSRTDFGKPNKRNLSFRKLSRAKRKQRFFESIHRYVSLETQTKDGINKICPYLRCPPLPRYKQLSMRCFFSFLNQKPSENSRRVTRVLLNPSLLAIGNYEKLDELLDEKNGWLSDGTLSIEYGFCVESMEGLDGIWKFNYHDKLFDCDQKQNMITYENDIPDGNDGLQLYIHKQLLEFHSPSFKNVIYTIPFLSYGTNLERIIEFFQISQGVRIGAPYHHDENAKRLSLLNVRRFCERSWIETESLCPFGKLCLWEVVSEFNYNRYLAILLKDVESGKQLAAILNDMDVEEMSSEFMKQYCLTLTDALICIRPQINDFFSSTVPIWNSITSNSPEFLSPDKFITLLDKSINQL
ncbi:hypothetical protein CRE_16075 [Caenorhabditis remanei]|uniref:Uncharacterized protein n=1 Tax=Caenorhabditis remanei TaxID=31234 RepID=E3MBP1_CAERE|nr:hypothetical protein CRE_16075 [Caenorhabditis remanei]